MTLHPSATPDDYADLEERAAIVQHVGGLPKEVAERVAVALVNRKIESRQQSGAVQG